jgi:hypothetical protein
MGNRSEFEPHLDLFEIRRELIALRSRHVEKHAVTKRINLFLSEIASLNEPNDRSHEQRLKQRIRNLVAAIDRAELAQGA